MSRKKDYYSEERKNYMLAVGQRIKYIRKKYGVSQTELIKRIDISKQGLSKIENGYVDVQLITLYEIAKGIGCLITEIFDFEYKIDNKS